MRGILQKVNFQIFVGKLRYFPYNSVPADDLCALYSLKNPFSGDFLLVNSETFEPISRWIPEGQNALPYNYDFWYQPRRGLMISTEWGSPKSIKQGFNPANVDKG